MRRYLLSAVVVLAAQVAIVTAASAQMPQAHAKAWVGINVETVDRETASANGYGVDYGARINEVSPNSPAEEAGLRQGDIIIRFDGQRVDEAGDIVRIADAASPGDRSSILIVRDGQERQLSFTFGDFRDRPSTANQNRGRSTTRDTRDPDVGAQEDRTRRGASDQPMNRGNQRSSTSGSMTEGPYIGIRLTPLNQQLADYFGVVNGRGVLVAEVITGSPAELAGLRAGDVIVAIDDRPVTDAQDVVIAIQNKGTGSDAILSIVRDRRTRTARVQMTEWSGQDGWESTTPSRGTGDPDRPGTGLGRTSDNPSMTNDPEGLRQEVEQLKQEVEILRRQVDDLEQRIE